MSINKPWDQMSGKQFMDKIINLSLFMFLLKFTLADELRGCVYNPLLQQSHF